MEPVEVLLIAYVALTLVWSAAAIWFQRRAIRRQAEMCGRVAELQRTIESIRENLHILSSLVGADESEESGPPSAGGLPGKH
ncbi:unnamed protein product, partial [marine sediment metagenome]